MHTPDLTAEKIRRIAELLPNCVTEAKAEDGSVRQAIDFDQLRQELSDAVVEGPAERYRLDWPGKREAILAANAPIAKTLRPVREESVDFDTTKNLFIEGDNLDALKLLQETYLGMVKLIYIDPPYNTGNDFVYKDAFAQDSETYLTQSNQQDKLGNRLVANTEANGRFHSDWLTMMYPRLHVARNLLKDEGVIFISIDDNEVHHLRSLCDQVFGPQNFIGEFVWKRRASSALAERLVSSDHEYVVCYQKQDFTSLGIAKEFSDYTNGDNDPRGEWVKGDLTVGMNKDQRPNQFYDLVDPKTGKVYPANPNRVWAYIPESMNKLIAENRVIFPEDVTKRPMLKRFKSELKTDVNPVSTWLDNVDLNSAATRQIQEIFGGSVFNYSKPVSLIKHLIKTSAEPDALIMDFFAGSSTAAHAVMELNAEDHGKRRFILVQLPEPIDEGTAAYQAGFRSIADISKERIRRVGASLKQLSSHTQSFDTGFRCLEIDTSNMQDVYYTPDQVQQASLLDHVDNIRPDRTPEDLLFQVLLDWGVDLAAPITTETIDSKQVFFVDGNALAACFDTGVTDELVKQIAARKPLRAVFRDSSYGSDSVKINVEQIFKFYSPDTEVRSI